MTTFCNVTLKLETSWAKKVVEFIWNFNDVIVYVWFIYFWIKKVKICNLEKYNFKWTKFTINPRLTLLLSTTLVLSI